MLQIWIFGRWNDDFLTVTFHLFGVYLGTIFAYGQTGCGKSHTMMGVNEPSASGEDLKGIIPKSLSHIFGCIDGDTNTGKKFLVRCAYLEIYNEAILDLLSKFGGANSK